METDFRKKKVQVIFVPRQIGKSTLAEMFFNNFNGRKIWLDADDATVMAQFEKADGMRLDRLFRTTELLVIDETQRINNVGLTLKIMADQLKYLHVIARGLNVFELHDKIKESMA